MEERADEINELLKRLSNNFMLIKLNFSNNDENNTIVDLAFKIYEGLRRHSLTSGWDQMTSEKELIQSLRETEKVFQENSMNAEKFTEFCETIIKENGKK